jgi:hypothetical protein
VGIGAFLGVFSDRMFTGSDPSPARYIGIRTLGRISFQSLERKRLRGKVSILLSLRDVPPRPGWGFCFVLTLDPHFVPIEKSSLTRARPGERPFLVLWLLGYDEGGHTSALLTGLNLFKKSSSRPIWRRDEFLFRWCATTYPRQLPDRRQSEDSSRSRRWC